MRSICRVDYISVCRAFYRMTLHFHQAFLIVFTFLSGGDWVLEPLTGSHLLHMTSPDWLHRLYLEQQCQDCAWHIRLVGLGPHALVPPYHSPAITTATELNAALHTAMERRRMTSPLILSRSIEPRIVNPPRSRSASPLPMRKGWTTQTSPRPG